MTLFEFIKTIPKAVFTEIILFLAHAPPPPVLFCFVFLAVKDLFHRQGINISQGRSQNIFYLFTLEEKEKKIKKSLPLKDSDFLSKKYGKLLEICFTADDI